MKKFGRLLFLIAVLIFSVIFFNSCDGMTDLVSSLNSTNQNKNLILLDAFLSQGDSSTTNDPGSSSGGPGSSSGGTGSTLMGWQLNEANTGLAGAGIDKNTLPVYTGSGTPAYGTTISLQKITKPLWLINGNITLDRCWIQPTSALTPEGLIITYNYGDGWTPAPYSSTIKDCDIDGTTMSAQAVAGACAVRGLANVIRCNIFGMGTGIAIFSYALKADCLVENNYVHDLRAYTGSHNESATVRSYLGNSLIWRNNRFVDKTGNDSGALFVQPFSTNIQHVLVEGNLLESYNYCIGIGNYGSNTYSDFKVKNNRFVKGGFGPVWLNNGVGFAEWTDNYYDNPSDPGHIGAIINKP
jgi:hypothetical protein